MTTSTQPEQSSNPEVEKIQEAYQAYKSKGYQGLLELARKRNEEYDKEQAEQEAN